MPSYTLPTYTKPNAANNWPGSASGKPNPSGDKTQSASDYAVFDASTGLYKNIRTQQPWTGKLQDGRMANGGKISDGTTTTTQGGYSPLQKAGSTGSTAIDPNNVAQRYQAVDVVKSPGVASATTDLLDEFKKSADQSLKGFDDYLKDFRSQADAAIARSKTSADPTATINTLQGSQDRYNATLDRNSADYTAANADAAARQRGIVTDAMDALPQYRQALTNAEGLAQAQAAKNVSRYGAGKNAAAGANLGLGSDVVALGNRASYEASQPYEMAKVNRFYDILSGLAMPTERDIANRDSTRLGQYQPMVAGAQFSSTQGTAKAIFDLKRAASAQDWETAFNIMRVPQVAAQVKQQILQGDTALLGMIAQLEESSHYRGLQDKLGANPSQPAYFGVGQPAYPSRYPSNQNPNLGPNAPGETGPASRGAPQRSHSDADMYYHSQTGYWPEEDPNFSQAAYDGIRNQMASSSRGTNAGRGSQSNSYYDPNTGAYIDKTTGEVTGYGPGGNYGVGDRYLASPPGDYQTDPAVANLE